MNKHNYFLQNRTNSQARGFSSEIHFIPYGQGGNDKFLSDKYLSTKLCRPISEFCNRTEPFQREYRRRDFFYDILCTVTGLNYEFEKLDDLFTSCHPDSIIASHLGKEEEEIVRVNDISYLNIAAKSLLGVIRRFKQELTMGGSGNEMQEAVHYTKHLTVDLEHKLYGLLKKLVDLELHYNHHMKCNNRFRSVPLTRGSRPEPLFHLNNACKKEASYHKAHVSWSTKSDFGHGCCFKNSTFETIQDEVLLELLQSSQCLNSTKNFSLLHSHMKTEARPKSCNSLNILPLNRFKSLHMTKSHPPIFLPEKDNFDKRHLSTNLLKDNKCCCFSGKSSEHKPAKPVKSINKITGATKENNILNHNNKTIRIRAGKEKASIYKENQAPLKNKHPNRSKNQPYNDNHQPIKKTSRNRHRIFYSTPPAYVGGNYRENSSDNSLSYLSNSFEKQHNTRMPIVEHGYNKYQNTPSKAPKTFVHMIHISKSDGLQNRHVSLDREKQGKNHKKLRKNKRYFSINSSKPFKPDHKYNHLQNNKDEPKKKIPPRVNRKNKSQTSTTPSSNKSFANRQEGRHKKHRKPEKTVRVFKSSPKSKTFSVKGGKYEEPYLSYSNDSDSNTYSISSKRKKNIRPKIIFREYRDESSSEESSHSSLEETHRTDFPSDKKLHPNLNHLFERVSTDSYDHNRSSCCTHRTPVRVCKPHRKRLVCTSTSSTSETSSSSVEYEIIRDRFYPISESSSTTSEEYTYSIDAKRSRKKFRKISQSESDISIILKITPKKRKKYIRVGSEKFIESEENIVEYEPFQQPIVTDKYSRGTSVEVLPRVAKRTSTTDLIKLIKTIGVETERVSTNEKGMDPIPQGNKTLKLPIEVKTKLTNTDKINMRSTGTSAKLQSPKPAMVNTTTDPLFYLSTKNKNTNTTPENKKQLKNVGTDPNIMEKVQQSNAATDPLHYLGQRAKFTNTQLASTAHAQTGTAPQPVHISKGTTTSLVQHKDQITSYDKVKTNDKGINPVPIITADKELQFDTLQKKPSVRTNFTETQARPCFDKITQTVFKQEPKPSLYEKGTQTSPKRPKPKPPKHPAAKNIDKPVREETSDLSMHLIVTKSKEEIYKRCIDVCKPKFYNSCNNKRKVIVCETKESNIISNQTKKPELEMKYIVKDENKKSTTELQHNFQCLLDHRSNDTTSSKNSQLTQNTTMFLDHLERISIKDDYDNKMYKKQSHIPRKNDRDDLVEDQIQEGTRTDVFESDTTVCSLDWKKIADKIKDI